MATPQHYTWAAGHFLLLFCASKYLLAWFTASLAFRAVHHSRLYSISYFGALISYAIVCYKSFGPQVTRPPNAGFLQRILLDENVQYFLLALFWWLSKPVPVSLIPFATFSLFHTLTFLRSNVLPHLFPPTPNPVSNQPSIQHPFLKKLQVWIKANYDPAMKVVAYAELLIFIRVVLGAITFQNSLLAPIVYAHFLRLRYYQSPFTQKAVQHVNLIIDKYAKAPGNPPMVANIWEKVQLLVSRWAGTVLTQQHPAAPAARR